MRSFKSAIILCVLITWFFVSLATVANGKGDVHRSQNSVTKVEPTNSDTSLSMIQVIFIVFLVIILIGPCIWGIYIACHLGCNEFRAWRRSRSSLPPSSAFYSQEVPGFPLNEDDPFADYRYSVASDDSMV